jgi:hypothetical protein
MDEPPDISYTKLEQRAQDNSLASPCQFNCDSLAAGHRTESPLLPTNIYSFIKHARSEQIWAGYMTYA